MGELDTAVSPGQLRYDEGFFAAKDNLRLFWRSVRPAEASAERAHLAVVHGYGDHSGRHKAEMEFLARRGIACHAFDYRGHGQSDGRRAYCDAFYQYLDDLEVLLGHARQAAEGKKLFLYGHSLGGLICARWALGRKSEVAGVIFGSPLMRLAFEPPAIKVWAAKAVDKILPWLPMGNELKAEQLTREVAIQEASWKDPLYLHVATPRWFNESHRVMDEVRRRCAEITLPALAVVGSDDPIVSAQAVRDLFAGLGSADKQLKEYAGARHELFNELERERTWGDFLAFIDSHLS